MKITCIGGAGTVTGSCHLLEADSIRLLIDCGMYQGSKQLEERNYLDFPFDPATISHLLLTHAHIDHSGLIPKLVRDGFQGSILCTTATADLCEIMLADSAHIQEMEAGWRNRKKKRAGRTRFLAPLYTENDAREAMHYFRPIDYNQEIILSPQARARFRDAGHILGSAIIELWVDENDRQTKLVFSGDLGNTGQPIIANPTKIDTADILFIESTYGNRLHKSMENTYEELRQVIIDAHQDGGNVIIPAFALGRTQELLYVINELYEQHLIPHMEVYVDSPLAISATKIFLDHPECFDADTMTKLRNGNHPLEFPGIHFTRSTEASMRLNQITGGAIIISASGMGHAGRIKHHLRYNLWRPEAHVVFVGYQAQGTTGRLIVDGARRVKIFGEEVAVNAHCHTIGGFSAHADQQGLLSWAGNFTSPPQTTFIVHGEPEASMTLCNQLENQLGWSAMVPTMGEILDINLAEGKIVPTETMVPPMAFEAELEHSWEELDEIMARLGDMEDIPDFGTRQQLASKLKVINSRLDDIKNYLAGREMT
ncbi:MAG: MBL fold metallo-hydrolase [Deltaproteobacteria bacterium]|nr:MBL fold metallo-hydrolase [Candidatus Anaeroferrophillus wilburensis]MBN2889694.1 MBL fold metallo-hydrolase [Deltaproteobacteria bacterium]